MRILSRLGIRAAAGIGFGVIAVIPLAVVDLYLPLSAADLALLLVVLLAADLTWFSLQRPGAVLGALAGAGCWWGGK